MNEIGKAYERGAGLREPYERQAERNEQFTVAVNIGRDGELIDLDRPTLYSDIGAVCVESLASVIVAFTFPVNQFFMRYYLETTDPQIRPTTQLGSQLAAGEKRAMAIFDDMRTKSVMGLAVTSALVASQIVVHGQEEDDNGPRRWQAFPLCEHVTEWIDNFNSRIITRRWWRKNPQDKDEKPIPLYTEIDFIRDRVRQELEDAITEVDNTNPRRWAVIMSQLPIPGQHFAIPFVSSRIRRIVHVNGLTRAFREIVFEAAHVLKGVRSGSGLDPHKLSRLVSGAWITMRREDDVFYPQQKAQLTPGLAAVLDAIERDSDSLFRDFLVGILGRIPEPETATLARLMQAKEDAIGARIFGHHQDHTAAPIARILQDLDGFRVETEKAKIVPKVLTGLSAISRQTEGENLLGLYERLAALDPNFAQEIPTHKIFQRLSDALSIETADLNPENAEALDVFRQLVSLIRKDPGRVLPMLLQLIQQFDPKAMEGMVQQAQLGAAVSQNRPALPPGGGDAAVQSSAA